MYVNKFIINNQAMAETVRKLEIELIQLGKAYYNPFRKQNT